jgi:hypothetical protein
MLVGKYAGVGSSFLTFWLTKSAQRETLMSDLGLQTRKVAESVRSTAGRRKSRWLRKHKQSVELAFVFPALALFEYMPLVKHSETSNLTWLGRMGNIC